jgi:hypothetical protein
MQDEARLLEKLRAIEALFAGATTEGERLAADQARQRIRTRIEELRAEAVVEWQFSFDPWSQRLFMALARRYGIMPYRYRRQRYSTLMVKAPERFLRDVLVPEYRQMAETLHAHLSAVTDRVVAEALDADTSDATIVDGEPKQLPG